MEGQLVYFTYLPSEGVWKLKSIPISQEYIDFTKPYSPNRSHPSTLGSHPGYNIAESLVEELSKLCGKNGAMEGWKLHHLGELEKIMSHNFNPPNYGAKVILTRPMKSLVPDVTTNVPTRIA